MFWFKLVGGRSVFFIHIPKTGGTSVSEALTEFCQTHPDLVEHYEFNTYRGQNIHWHIQWNQLEPMIQESDRQDLYVFTIIRNPWDRLVSGWKYALQDLDDPKFIRQRRLKSANDKVKRRIQLKMDKINKKETLKRMKYDFSFYLAEPNNYIYSESIICSQKKWCKSSGGFDVDGIRFDQLNNLEELLSKKIGSEIVLTLPNSRSTQHDRYHTYYDNETMVKKVEQMCQWEINGFGFRFD